MSDPATNSFKTSNKEKILTIVTGGVCIALSFVLSQLKLFEMPMGGSVTPASTLPLVVFAMAFGPVWGFVAAFIFSLLQLIGGELYTPFQVILDYTLGFTALGITGFAAAKNDIRSRISSPLKRFVASGLIRALLFTTIAYVVRFICSVLSGVIFFAEYAPEGMNPWVYSMAYNGPFLAADLAIVLVVTVILYMTMKGTSRKQQ